MCVFSCARSLRERERERVNEVGAGNGRDMGKGVAGVQQEVINERGMKMSQGRTTGTRW